MGKALRYLGRLVRGTDGKAIRGTDATCCCGGGGAGTECDCTTSYVYECPGDEEALCCSALQFDLVTEIRCETNSTVDPSAWGLPLFGYTSGLPAAPTDGVLLDGYFEYENVLSVRCKDGVQRVRQFGSFRWGVNYYDSDGANHADNGEITWDVPPTDSGALLVSVDTVHAPGYNPVTVFPPSSPDTVLESLLPPLYATVTDCVETYTVGSLATTVLPYFWVPTGFAVGGIQFTGTGTSTASCATRSSAMRFEWDFLGASSVRYGGSVQTWDFSETTFVYEECDPDPCDA
jgi:hypothetical protein